MKAEEIKVWGESHDDLWSYGRVISVPSSYVEIAPGDAFVTRKIKEFAEVVYLRMRKSDTGEFSTVVGILAPPAAINCALAAAAETEAERARRREQSAAHRAKRRQLLEPRICSQTRSMFPGLDDMEVELVARQILKAGRERLLRSSSADVVARITLIVRAYAWRVAHMQLINQGYGKEIADEKAASKVDGFVNYWTNASLPPVAAAQTEPNEEPTRC